MPRYTTRIFSIVGKEKKKKKTPIYCLEFSKSRNNLFTKYNLYLIILIFVIFVILVIYSFICVFIYSKSHSISMFFNWKLNFS